MMKTAMMLLAGAACVLADESKGASLAVFKVLGSDDVVVGMNLSVSVSVYNLGDSAAFNVVLDDTKWTNVGEAKGVANEWDTIAPGDVKTVEYVVVPQEAGVMGSEPARVTFKDDSSSEQVKAAFSNHVYDTTSVGAADGVVVLTEAEYEKKASKRVKEWFTFVLLLFIPLGMPFFFYNQSSNNLKAKREASKKLDEPKPSSKASPKRKSSPTRKGSPGKN